jgi:hypothetical protein
MAAELDDVRGGPVSIDRMTQPILVNDSGSHKIVVESCGGQGVGEAKKAQEYTCTL